MGLFEEIGKRIDRGIVRFIGKPLIGIGQRITGFGERIEKKFAPTPVPVRKKTWRDKVDEAIPDDIGPGDTDEDVRNKYDKEREEVEDTEMERIWKLYKAYKKKMGKKAKSYEEWLKDYDE